MDNSQTIATSLVECSNAIAIDDHPCMHKRTKYSAISLHVSGVGYI